MRMAWNNVTSRAAFARETTSDVYRLAMLSHQHDKEIEAWRKRREMAAWRRDVGLGPLVGVMATVFGSFVGRR